MDPVDVTPLRSHPDTVADPQRRAAHAHRYDAQTVADTARTALLGALTDNGVSDGLAAALTDQLIKAVRIADAHRLDYARSGIRDFEQGQFWDGINDLNGAVGFLHNTAHAAPVRPA